MASSARVTVGKRTSRLETWGARRLCRRRLNGREPLSACRHRWREPGAGGRYGVTGYCSARRANSARSGGAAGGGPGQARFRWRDVADPDVADTGAGIHAGRGFGEDDDAAADGDLLEFLLDGVGELGRREPPRRAGPHPDTTVTATAEDQSAWCLTSHQPCPSKRGNPNPRHYVDAAAQAMRPA
jgi:hypothetical protein